MRNCLHGDEGGHIDLLWVVYAIGEGSSINNFLVCGFFIYCYIFGISYKKFSLSNFASLELHFLNLQMLGLGLFLV